MLVSRLLRSLLRFFSPGIVPDEGGGAAPVAAPAEPVAAAPVAAPAAEPVAAPAALAVAATPAEPADKFAGLRDAIDKLGEPTPAPGAAPAPNRSRDPGGRFATGAQSAAGVVAPAAPAQAAAPAAPVPPAPKPGEVDLTPPEGMSDRARERWGNLTERAKLVPQLEQQVAQVGQQLQAVRQMVNESGLAPQEFTQLLETARLARSANPQDAQRALQALDAQRAEIAQRFGLDVAGIDVLAAHPDLKADVDGMLMTRERALEIARYRQQNQQMGGQLQAITSEQREFQQHQQAVQTGARAIDSTLAALAGTPGHADKVGYVKAHLADPNNMKRFVETYQPQQWPAVVLAMYHAYTPQAAPPPPPLVQPLRSTNVRPGTPTLNGPVTATSAVDAAFAAAGL